MKMIFALIVGIALSHATFAQDTIHNYDQRLADSLGADAYGMKTYYLVMLKTGQEKIEDRERVAQIFRGHMENINRLVEDKKLIIAGPISKNENNYRGIFILDTGNEETAKSLVETDPAIKEGLLDAEIYEWYGSAALPLYLPAAKKIAKENP